ncbi:MAG: hypothetical protein V8R80_08885 [Eubacterium sp.]
MNSVQTIHPETAAFIRREFSLSCYEDAAAELNRRQIPVISHIILGLPGEDRGKNASDNRIHGKLSRGIKLQLLHILEQTDLADYYRQHPFPLFSLESYCDFIVDCIERLPESMVIHRITGDGPEKIC